MGRGLKFVQLAVRARAGATVRKRSQTTPHHPPPAIYHPPRLGDVPMLRTLDNRMEFPMLLNQMELNGPWAGDRRVDEGGPNTLHDAASVLTRLCLCSHVSRVPDLSYQQGTTSVRIPTLHDPKPTETTQPTDGVQSWVC